MTRRLGHLITIGSFDGVHLGHAALLDRTVLEARKRKLSSLALTFDIPPRMVLNRGEQVSVLSDPFEKELLIKSRGIQNVVRLNFNRDLAQMRPHSFFKDVLLKKFRAKGIVLGLDFRFGINRSAGVMEMVRWGQENRIPVWVIPVVKLGKEIISSTEIRRLLLKNNLKKAVQFLGHPYLIHGSMIKGRGMGKKIGFPTTNLKTAPGKVLPQGVFVVRGTLPEKPGAPLKGVCNIGRRPTFLKHSGVVVEPHWLVGKMPPVSKSIYIELLERLRNEKKFKSPAALQKAIRTDIGQTQRFFHTLQKGFKSL